MRTRRSWKARIAEFLIWTAVAIGVAVLLSLFSDQILPPNF